MVRPHRISRFEHMKVFSLASIDYVPPLRGILRGEPDYTLHYCIGPLDVEYAPRRLQDFCGWSKREYVEIIVELRFENQPVSVKKTCQRQ